MHHTYLHRVEEEAKQLYQFHGFGYIWGTLRTTSWLLMLPFHQCALIGNILIKIYGKKG
jgi:hypothetical protein